MKALVIGGEKDGDNFPALAKHIADSIPGSELVLFPNVGHVPHIQVPEMFNKELLKFLLKSLPFDGLRVLSLNAARRRNGDALIRKQGGEPFVAPSMPRSSTGTARRSLRFRRAASAGGLRLRQSLPDRCRHSPALEDAAHPLCGSRSEKRASTS